MDISLAKFGPGYDIGSGSDSVPLQQFGPLRRFNTDGSTTMIGALNSHTDTQPWDWCGYTFVGRDAEVYRFDDRDAFLDVLARDPPHVLHTHTRGKSIARLVQTLSAEGTRIVHTMHGMDELQDPLAHTMFALADMVTSPSSHAVAKIGELHDGRYAHKAFHVPNCTDFAKYKYDPVVHRLADEIRSKHLADYGRLVLISGRLQEDKGVFELGEAVAQLIEEGHNLTLMHVGMVFDPADERRMKEIFSRRGLDKNLALYGKVDGNSNPQEMAATYWAADMFVMPADGTFENAPMCALEALALEKPSAVSNVGGPKSFFVDTGFATGIDARSVEATKDVVRYLVRNYDEEKAKAKAVSTIIENAYSSDAVAMGLLRVYDALVRTDTRSLRARQKRVDLS